MKRELLSLFALLCICWELPAQWTQGLTFSPALSLIEEVHFSGPSFGFAAATANGSSNGYILKSTNGGATWAVNYTTSVGTVNDVHFPAGQTSIGYASGAKVYKTTNAGVSWDTIFSPLEDGGKIYFTSTTEGYMSGGINSGLLWKTTDGGNNWSNLTIPGFRPKQIQFLTSSVGFVAGGDVFSGGNGTVIKTTDAGNSWVELDYRPALNGQPTAGFDGMYWLDQNNAFVGGQGGIMVKTTDGGLNWTQVATADPDSALITDIWFTSPAVGFYSTILGQIYGTNNGGGSWTLSGTNQGGSFGLYCLEFADANTAFAGGLLGTYLYTINAGGLLSTGPISAEQQWIEVFPNPSNGSFRLKGKEHLGADASVQVTDLSGRVVFEEEVAGWKLDAGLDCQLKVGAGCYALTVKASGKSKTVKLVVE